LKQGFSRHLIFFIYFSDYTRSKLRPLESQKHECICLLDPRSDLEELYDSSVTNPAHRTMSVIVVTQKTHRHKRDRSKPIETVKQPLYQRF
jgi:hypothetical protein